MGYTVADGTTMYTTPSAVTLYVVGAKIPAVFGSTTECCAFDSSGNLVPLQHKGPAGTPLEIVKAPVFVGDGTVTATNISNAGATIVSQIGTATATIAGDGTISFPIGDYEEIVLSNGSHYSCTEGTPTNPSLVFYDRSSNGNHIDLVNSSAANWALKERESYPLNDGFTDNTTELIPSLLSNKALDAVEDPIQYTAKQTMNADNPTVVSLAPSQPVIESENNSGNRLFTDGSGNMTELTFGDFSSNFHDIVFHETPDKLVVYTQPITGDCLAKTKKYVGIEAIAVHTEFSDAFDKSFA